MVDNNDNGPLRIMLWAPPRSLSTAFERCIASSGDDVHVFHEMFTAAYHLGPERQAVIPVSWAKHWISDKRFTYDWVRQELENSHRDDGTKVIFCKELGYTMQRHFKSLPVGYRHTFLIRHPAKVFLSMNKLINKFIAKHVLKLNIIDLLPQGLIFKELYELFYYVTNTLGQEPIIIDADDLVEKPEMTLRAYCKAVGIPYSSSMINWNPLKKERDRWSFSKSLMFSNKVVGQYDRAFSTSGLESCVEKPLDLTTITPPVLLATEASVEYYEKLYKLRLQPIDSNDMISNEVVSDAPVDQTVSTDNHDSWVNISDSDEISNIIPVDQPASSNNQDICVDIGEDTSYNTIPVVDNTVSSNKQDTF